MHFEPYYFKVVAGKATTQKVSPQFAWASINGEQWLPCGTFDLVWTTFSRIYVHRTPGVLETVMLPKAGEDIWLHDVIWDGRSIWAATYANEIQLLTLDGACLRRIGKADGLPTFDKELKMYPVAPGKVIAVGTFGADQRAWCALLTWDGKQATVKVFHQATEVMTAKDNAQSFAFNTHAAFIPQAIVPMPAAASGGAPMIAVTRKCVALTGGNLLVDLAPLTLNLNTLEVGVWHVLPDQPMAASPIPTLTIPQGLILQESEASGQAATITYGGKPAHRLLAVTNPGKILPDVWDANSAEKVENVIFPHSPNVTLQPYTDGLIYVTGPRWWRIDPITLTAQRLTNGELPQPYRYIRYTRSSLLGLIGWDADKGQCYRITIDETKIPKEGE